jgi:hypothetical protein
MTTKAELEVLLQGKDEMNNQIIEFFISRGWAGDRIIKNIATKTYHPNSAVVRVMLDSVNGLYRVSPEYVSCGENVLRFLDVYIRSSTDCTQLQSILEKQYERIEKEINCSFAVRFLGNG